MSAAPSDSDFEFMILKRVSDGPVPVNTGDASAVAPLQRWSEIIKAGLVEGNAIAGPNGEILKVIARSLHYDGRVRLVQLSDVRKACTPKAVVNKWLVRGLWAALGIGGTLLTQWLSKTLGLSK